MLQSLDRGFLPYGSKLRRNTDWQLEGGQRRRSRASGEFLNLLRL